MKNENAPEKEIEVKFHICNPEKLIAQLDRVGAQMVQPRVLETNLRFDTPNMALSKGAKVLRLRLDNEAHLTYKGPGAISEGALSRQEIEFTVSDFTAAQHFLKALGYHVILTYEKYRQTYCLDDMLITIDEMPYGNFSEIEGLEGNMIEKVAHLLHLDWSRRINGSYADIFRLLKAQMDLPFEDLTFDNFKDIPVDLSILNILTAD